MDTPKTEADWKKKLTPRQFHVLREKGTELAFTGKFLHNKKQGTYMCAACSNKLFSSDKKFDSGTGWPSFSEAVKGSVKLKQDFSHGMQRTEVVCSKCNSHLGHIFNDCPKPTGRFCINSSALGFREGGRGKVKVK